MTTSRDTPDSDARKHGPQAKSGTHDGTRDDGFVERVVEVRGQRYHLRENSATGPTVLFVHGWPDDHTVWRHQQEQLAHHGFHTVAFDWPAHGGSSTPDDLRRCSVSELATDTVALLDALNIDTVHLVAHDYGATVSWHTVATYPSRFASYTAVSVGHSTEILKDLVTGAWFRYAWLFFHGMDRAVGWYLADDARRFRARLAAHPDADYVLEKLRSQENPVFFTVWEKANPPIPAALRQIFGSTPRHRVPIPTLGLYGRDDRFMTEGQMARSYRHVDGEWEYHSLSGGHWLPLQHPDPVGTILLDWLKRRGT